MLQLDLQTHTASLTSPVLVGCVGLQGVDTCCFKGKYSHWQADAAVLGQQHAQALACSSSTTLGSHVCTCCPTDTNPPNSGRMWFSRRGRCSGPETEKSVSHALHACAACTVRTGCTLTHASFSFLFWAAIILACRFPSSTRNGSRLPHRDTLPDNSTRKICKSKSSQDGLWKTYTIPRTRPLRDIRWICDACTGSCTSSYDHARLTVSLDVHVMARQRMHARWGDGRHTPAAIPLSTAHSCKRTAYSQVGKYRITLRAQSIGAVTAGFQI
jgi:hypothetical protein